MILLAATVGPAAAAPVELLADLVTEPVVRAGNPSGFMTVNGVVIFWARDPQHGGELWSTDGTAGGTRLISDRCPGACSGSAWRVEADDQRLYWVGGDQVFSQTTWVSDGTPEGTHRATAPEYDDYLLGVVGGLLFSYAWDQEAGLEPWVSDGTPSGRRLLRDVCPGPCSSFPPPPGGDVGLGPPLPTGVRLGDQLFFFADDGKRGQELWKADGNEASRVKDVCPGACGSRPRHLTVFQDALFFVADDGIHGEELWRTDGTAAGTSLAADLTPGPEGTLVSRLVATNGTLYVLGEDCSRTCVWRSDGTPAGSRPATELGGFVRRAPADAVAAGSYLLLTKPGKDGAGEELWSSDGSGIKRLTLAGCSIEPLQALADGRVFFRARDAEDRPSSLWVTDGRRGHTRSLGAVDVSLLAGSAELDGRLLFSTEQGPVPGGLWASDGTVSGTAPIVDLRRDDSSSNPFGLRAVGSGVVFGIGSETWAAGVAAAPEPLVAQRLLGAMALGERALIVTDFVGDPRLSDTDGTAAGTRKLMDFDVVGREHAVLDGVAYFRAGGSGQELWRSDGTLEGTYRVKRLSSVEGHESPRAFAPLGGKLYFLTFDGQQSRLWRSNGSEAGTVALKHFQGRLTELTPVGSRLFFFASEPVAGKELWSSDGTAAGTRRVADLEPGAASSVLSHLTALGSRALFVRGVAGGDELWESNATASRARRVADLSLDGEPSRVLAMVASGPRLFLSVFNAGTGVELWTSNRTAAGTRLVADLRPGPIDGTARRLLPLGDGRVVFSGDDGTTGFEPWSSDGTREGTLLVEDLAPGLDASGPDALTRAAARIVFSADDGVHGRELFAVELTDVPVPNP